MLEHERLACLVSGASTTVRVERSVDALCALSEWDGFQITLERGRGKAAYESSQASLFLRLRKTSLHF